MTVPPDVCFQGTSLHIASAMIHAHLMTTLVSSFKLRTINRFLPYSCT